MFWYRPMSRRPLTLLALATVLGLFAIVIALPDGDADLWGRMAFARDAAAAGRLLIDADPYSYTAPGAPWFDHEWGFNWLAWETYSAQGWPGVRMLRILLFAAAAALVLVSVERDRSAKGPPAEGGRALALVLLAAVWSLGSYGGFYGPRAQSVGYVLFAWLMLCLRRAPLDGERWLVFGVLPLFGWVNVHAGFIAGLGVAGVWGAWRLCELAIWRRLNQAWPVLLAGGIALLALFCTPIGVEMSLFAFRSSLYARPFIPEWSPLALGSRELWVALLLLALATPKLLLERPRRWPEWTLLGIVAFVTFRHARHLPFLAITSVVLCGPAFLGWAQRWPVPRLPPLGRIVGLVLLALAGVGVWGALSSAVRRPEPREPLFPSTAVAHLRQRHAGEGGIVEFNWSMYTLFHAPEVKLAFDGRYTDVYPFEIYKQYFQWHFGIEGAHTLLEDPRTRFVLVATGSERDQRMGAQSGWARSYGDAVATAYARSGE